VVVEGDPAEDGTSGVSLAVPASMIGARPRCIVLDLLFGASLIAAPIA
jgi:hypothetical protein